MIRTDLAVQFGRFEDVINDCCGFCPEPVTDKEKEIYEEESKIYVRGKISFLKDDPGRQVTNSVMNTSFDTF